MIYGVGYNSKGKYPTRIDGKDTKCYCTWRNMLQRCYYSKYHEKESTYIDCEVAKEWLDYQVFAEWWHQNYYTIEGEKMCLDKDILMKDNKVYSPDTCVFVSSKINSLFTKCNENRGNLPIGVAKNGNGYQTCCANGSGKNIPLGTFPTVHEAFLMYKINKELLIESVAEEYKAVIPSKLYEALMKYEVSECD